MSDDNEDRIHELKEARIAVLDRLVAAGWISQVARRGDDTSIVPTEKGIELFKEVFTLFSNPASMTANELIAFNHWITRFGPR